MSHEELAESFKKASREYLRFEKIENTLSCRPDLHAMMLLDRLVPGTHCIIACAEHDKVWFDVDIDELCKVITPELVVELASCCVMYDDDNQSLYMFA